MRGVCRSLCPRKTDGSAPVGSVELKRQKDSCEVRAADRLKLWASEQKDRLAWFNETDLAVIRDAGGPGLQVLTEPPLQEFGWRTGKEALLGEKRTLEEAAALRRALRDAKKTEPRPASLVPPEGQAAGLSSSDADEIDLALDNLGPDEPGLDSEERLPLGWEKKITAVDLKWFSTARNEFLTDEELRT